MAFVIWGLLRSKRALYLVNTSEEIVFLHLRGAVTVNGESAVELSDDEARDFFYDHMDANLNLDDIEYTVEIPQAIINKAEQ